MYFAEDMTGEKVDLSQGYWNPKRKIWVNVHFKGIINQP